MNAPAPPPIEDLSTTLVDGETSRINAALLQHATRLVDSPGGNTVLQRLCEALVAASPHIRLAWIWIGSPQAQEIRPQIYAGPASDYAHQLRINRNWLTRKGPVFQAMLQREIAWMRISRLSLYRPWRVAARRHGFGEAIAMRLDDLPADQIGLVVFYADQPDYFERVGLAPFRAFVDLARAALRQSHTLEQLERAVRHDALTGLLNRYGMREVLDDALARARELGEPFGLILLDLDRFKLLNDSYGHPAGDSALVHLARVLRDSLREVDRIGRWGGEEFLVLLPRVGLDGAIQTAERLRERIAARPLQLGQRQIALTASFGAIAWQTPHDSVDRLLAQLDSLLYDAKRSGRNTVRSPLDAQSGVLSLGARLQDALSEGRLRVAYQPLIDLQHGAVIGYEALARLIAEDGKIEPAGRFIEAAHRLRLEHRIDSVVIEQALTHCAQVNADTAACQSIRHLLNCSADFLSRKDCVDRLLGLAHAHCAACRHHRPGELPVIIEITERQLLQDRKATLAQLQALLDVGFELAIDDFGSGYSSFLYLLDLPVRYLKIEMALVQRAQADPRALTMIRSIQSMAHDLGIRTIAEGIETEAQAAQMRDIGIDWGQGFLWGKPALEDSAPRRPLPIEAG
ncbi:MAG: putative bifunctional diguanylate cyclase/phosphodiesterase [Thiomonas sp.]